MRKLAASVLLAGLTLSATACVAEGNEAERNIASAIQSLTPVPSTTASAPKAMMPLLPPTEVYRPSQIDVPSPGVLTSLDMALQMIMEQRGISTQSTTWLKNQAAKVCEDWNDTPNAEYVILGQLEAFDFDIDAASYFTAAATAAYCSDFTHLLPAN